MMTTKRATLIKRELDVGEELSLTPGCTGATAVAAAWGVVDAAARAVEGEGGAVAEEVDAGDGVLRAVGTAVAVAAAGEVAPGTGVWLGEGSAEAVGKLVRVGVGDVVGDVAVGGSPVG